MKRGYAGDIVPLLPAMLAGADVDQGKGSAQPAEPHHTPVDLISSTSQPPIPSPPHPSPLHQSPPHSPHQSLPYSLPHSPPQSPPHFLPPRINSLEKELKETKQTLGNAMVKLVKNVKSLETAFKRKSKKVLISELEGEESEDQGRKIQDIDDDTLVSLVRESMKEKSTDFVTPIKASGEAQEEEISPTILEAAKENIVQEEINTGREEINTGIEEVSTGSTKVDSMVVLASINGVIRGRKALMVEEDIQATHKIRTNETRGQEAWIGRGSKVVEAQLDEDVVKLDSFRLKMDAIKAKLEANAELTKDVLGKDLPGTIFCKQNGDMVNQEKTFVEKRAKAKRNKPMIRITIKEEFDKLVQQIDTFVPMDFEATKAKLKRYGEELQTKTSKKQKIDDKDVPAIGEKVAEVKEEEPVKRTGKRKKQKARKGISVDKNAQGDSETDKEESVEAMNPTPLATKSNIVVNWKIFQQGQRSIYQIMRANGADTVYMSFGAMVKDFTREDLIELYRLVMQKYGTNRPEDAYDRVLWSDLRTMFDPPLNEDAIWSLPLQQKMIN
ncbi:hypothetical protein Tco_1394925 [Tanacetum coccineum]